jgi:DNA polymerase
MTAQTPLISAAEIAGALDWWRLAGVEVDALDEARGWLDVETDAPTNAASAAATAKPSPPPQQVPAAAPPRMPGIELEGLARVPGDADSWPSDLATFRQWWLEEEKFSPAGAFPRVPPRGAAQAKLMLVVGQPEEPDSDRLLSGPLGQVLNGFLRAAGIGEGEIYIASALPRHTLRPDWAEVGAAGFGDLLAHHISLVAPERVIIFGRDILALLPHASAQDPASLRIFNHEGRDISLLPARDLANLARRGGFRARFWQQWLDFTDG